MQRGHIPATRCRLFSSFAEKDGRDSPDMASVNLPLPCEAYKGTEPYVFVSYSHKDGAIVYPQLEALHEAGYRVWYDEGIDPGNEWPEEIALALQNAAWFLVFLTSNAVSSRNVKNEIHFALDQSKPFLAIHVEEMKLPLGLALQMGSIQAIHKWRMPDDLYRRKLLKTLPENLRDTTATRKAEEDRQQREQQAVADLARQAAERRERELATEAAAQAARAKAEQEAIRKTEEERQKREKAAKLEELARQEDERRERLAAEAAAKAARARAEQEALEERQRREQVAAAELARQAAERREQERVAEAAVKAARAKAEQEALEERQRREQAAAAVLARQAAERRERDLAVEAAAQAARAKAEQEALEERQRREQAAAAELARQEALARPSIKFVAVLDEREVRGAKVSYGADTWETPVVLNLTKGASYLFKCSHTDAAGRAYAGESQIAATWSGEQTQRIALAPKRSQAATAGLAPKNDALTVDLGGGVKLECVLIRPGAFIMGTDQSDEKPAHKVRLTKPFYMGKFAVTQAQWERIMGANPSGFKGAKLPVERVSWDDCQEFIDKLNLKLETVPLASGMKASLPTEAQWEYACRAGTATAYSFRDSEAALGDHAWYEANSGTTTHKVGKKKPNAWGLFDMHGNVYEWCSDWYGAYTAVEAVDPIGPSSSSCRVLRGGSWCSNASDCRSAYRFCDVPSARSSDFGLRLVVVPR